MDYQTLNLLFRCHQQFSHERIHVKDLSDTECMICSYIYSHNDCTQGDISNALKIDKTTIAKSVVTLEKKKCIERTQNSHDLRKKCLRLTNTGSDKIADLIGVHNEWLSEIMTCLSPSEQNQFENYCERLLVKAEAFAKYNTSGEKQNA